MTLEIILDANFLLLPHKKKIDIFTQIPELVNVKHEVVTLESVFKEVESLSKGASDDAFGAKTALKLVSANNIRIIESKKPADDAIIEYCKGGKDVVVCTNDRELKRKLKAMGVETISLQGADKLTIN